MKANAFNPKENSFYGDVEHDFKEIVARIQYNLLMDGYAWGAVNGKTYHLYYDHFHMTGVLFREEDFEEELKETLRRVAETLGYVITGEDCSGIDITIPLEVVDELSYAQKEYLEHCQEAKNVQRRLLPKAIDFVKRVNTEIEENQYMSYEVKTNGSLSLLWGETEIKDEPLVFVDLAEMLFQDYWRTQTNAKNCTVKIQLNEIGCWITISIEE